MTMKKSNKRLEVFYKAQAFLVMTLSSLGFTVGLVFVRLWGEEENLADILNYQSSVTLLSFILQLGYRASLRKFYYEGYERIVSISHDFFYIFIVVSALCSYVIQYYTGINLYLVSSLVVAYLTFLQTQAVIKQDLRAQVYSALGNFFICAVAGMGVVLLSIENFYIFEGFSLFILFLFPRSLNVRKVFARRSLIAEILIRSQSYQIGSMMIMLMVFVLTQSVIHKYSNSKVIVAFADVQLVSGFLTLIFGQTLVLFEKKLYVIESARYFVFLRMLLFIAGVSAIASLLFSYLHGVNFYLLFVFLIVLNSRVLIGYVIQYADNNRMLINVMAIALSLIYGAYYFSMLGEGLIYQIIPVILVLTVGCYLLYPAKREVKC